MIFDPPHDYRQEQKDHDCDGDADDYDE